MDGVLKEKHQIYVIAPLIEESENSDLTNVLELKDKMNLAFGSKFKIDIKRYADRETYQSTEMFLNKTSNKN